MHRFASPAEFAKIRAAVLPFAVCIAVLTGILGLYLALFNAPADYQQGEAVRIMYIHVPAAWMSTMVYGLMAVLSASFLIWRHPLADLLARQAAPLGAAFTAITLITGMLWGKPMWNTWWQWQDARLTSVFILMLLYLGYMALWNAIEDEARAARAATRRSSSSRSPPCRRPPPKLPAQSAPSSPSGAAGSMIRTRNWPSSFRMKRSPWASTSL